MAFNVPEFNTNNTILSLRILLASTNADTNARIPKEGIIASYKTPRAMNAAAFVGFAFVASSMHSIASSRSPFAIRVSEH